MKSSVGEFTLAMRSKAIPVAGGAGYIGSHTARALRRHRHEVIIYDNLSTGYNSLADGFELIVGDIADQEKLARADANCGSYAFRRSRLCR
jgi:UDP-glucose 4-epimerase